MSATHKPWPPPPDAESIRELVRAADPEGHLAEGAHADEYEPEEEQILAVLQPLPTEQLTADVTLPLIESVWRRSFTLDHDAMIQRRPALSGLAQQIERFFGPDAKPQVR